MYIIAIWRILGYKSIVPTRKFKLLWKSTHIIYQINLLCITNIDIYTTKHANQNFVLKFLRLFHRLTFFYLLLNCWFFLHASEEERLTLPPAYTGKCPFPLSWHANSYFRSSVPNFFRPVRNLKDEPRSYTAITRVSKLVCSMLSIKYMLTLLR